ncbi:MAG: hypothetical protein ACOYXC_13890 [Candidatus Rifleibacteriota bacterium]
MQIILKTGIFSLLLAIIAVFSNFQTVMAQELPETELKSTLIASIDFVPEVLEMVRRELSEQTRRGVSLIFQPAEPDFAVVPERKPQAILIEEGLITPENLQDYNKSPVKIELVWVMIFHSSILPLIGDELTPESFGKALLQYKKKHPFFFPWFESLFSKHSLLNFCLNFSNCNTKEKYEKKPFWQQSGAIRLLYRAMEEGLLNPLSVEADQMLACKVFSAGDSVCFSMWVPIKWLNSPELVKRVFGDARIGVFKLNEHRLLPRLSLELWLDKSSALSLVASETACPALEKYEIIEAGHEKKRAWFKKGFSEAYDSLIMGDF